MANLIILEGVSRTGKSSITSMLSEKHGFRSISVKNKQPEFIENLPDFYHGMHIVANEFFKAFNEETFVLDRSFISELVYSRAFGRKTYINKDDLITDFLHDNNFLLINLITTHQEYLNRLPKDKKVYTYDEFNNHKDLFFYYTEHFKTHYTHKKWQSSFIEIDTNQNSIEKCVQKIEECLENKLIIKKQNI